MVRRRRNERRCDWRFAGREGSGGKGRRENKVGR
jgi:hypothetical protein